MAEESFTPDGLDREIIALLRGDGRMSTQDLAKAARLHPLHCAQAHTQFGGERRHAGGGGHGTSRRPASTYCSPSASKSKTATRRPLAGSWPICGGLFGEPDHGAERPWRYWWRPSPSSNSPPSCTRRCRKLTASAAWRRRSPSRCTNTKRIMCRSYEQAQARRRGPSHTGAFLPGRPHEQPRSRPGAGFGRRHGAQPHQEAAGEQNHQNHRPNQLRRTETCGTIQ